jgi:hypothetical protein
MARTRTTPWNPSSPAAPPRHCGSQFLETPAFHLAFGGTFSTFPHAVSATLPSSFSRCFFVLVAAGFLTGCDTPQKRGLRELTKAGIEPTGTALLQAVADKDAKRAGWLIDVGVYTEQRDAKGRTPLRVAMENRDLSSVFKLLDGHANVNATAPDNASILGIAVELGETAMVERLIAAGAKADG